MKAYKQVKLLLHNPSKASQLDEFALLPLAGMGIIVTIHVIGNVFVGWWDPGDKPELRMNHIHETFEKSKQKKSFLA